MTDYSKMSDFEINKLVAIQLGMKPFCETTGWQGLTSEPYVDVIVRGAGRMGAFNPCNNPSDAWPIIASSRISIEFDGDGSTEPQSVWCNVTNFQRTCGIKYQKTPLRAAMIVYLMMKGSENG
ncbi:phage protein NinX family protein [Obesumbacterium proteus]|uniref:phage protein NinX family protein n=1 Tax=Obesumbacterium proteus TaxID=82983 RepID=UPI00242E279F|nr:phage protein NinX family protein [Obesumbacterium proteus]